MSTNRTRRATTPVKFLPRGHNGRCLCRQCNVEVPKGRVTFCGDKCVHDWKLRGDPQYLRGATFKRDKGVCRKCGFYCHEADQAVKQIIKLLEWRHGEFASGPHVKALKESLGLGGRASFWEADHIVPVAQGGGECGLENIQTLCIFCHKTKTLEQVADSTAKKHSLG